LLTPLSLTLPYPPTKPTGEGQREQQQQVGVAAVMAARIYVGNLPMDIRERDLEEMFGKWREAPEFIPPVSLASSFLLLPFFQSWGQFLPAPLAILILLSYTYTSTTPPSSSQPAPPQSF
jgi:hypothetical protein